VYVSPGAAGENQVWDFSAIQVSGKTSYRGVSEDMTHKMAGPGERNIVLAEDGYEYSYICSENSIREIGYANPGKKMTLGYDTPLVQMKYPFSFGQQFAQPCSGIAWYHDRSRIDFSGTYAVTADAYGTLILPDRIMKNTLRVKVVKQSLQISVCGSTQSTSTKYFWYAPGYRYPVLMLGTTENKYGAKEPVTHTNAWLNLNQASGGAASSVTLSDGQSETSENTVIVFPNPFSEQVTFNYFLRSQVPVSIELYDMSGKFNILVEKKKTQLDGLHTGTLNASKMGLPPGVYYLRFTFDRQVVVSKIVKI
jgi:hypothetical protein